MTKDIQSIIRKVLADIELEKVILFGSRARGDFIEESDYDILIIVKDRLNIKEKMGLTKQLRQEFAKEGIDADIIIKSKDEIEYYRDKIGSVIKSALEEGVAI
ncbi:nucleotidyltransferase domain-containing protein [Candidatus Pyrohabitans sp.]